MPLVWMDNTFVDESAASIPLRDTGLLHAAGVFTTMRSYDGRVFRLAENLKRLRDSCEALFIPLQYPDDALAAAVDELLRRSELSDARLRLTVTRGTAQQDPLHGMHLQPTVFLTAAPIEPYPPEFYAKGLTVALLDEWKLNPYDLQAGHKTLNYLSRLAGLREANRRGAGEAIWFNVHNYLESGSISNVFVVKGGMLITPPTNAELRDPAVAGQTAYPRSAVLPCVTRAAVINLAREAKIDVNLASLSVSDLLDADEVFVTNSIMQVMPVCRVERKAIGNEKPGPVTLRTAELLQAAISTSSSSSE
ncbi:MAG: aminotransferase class IV [Tepidisphaeraceae bacterium]